MNLPNQGSKILVIMFLLSLFGCSNASSTFAPATSRPPLINPSYTPGKVASLPPTPVPPVQTFSLPSPSLEASETPFPEPQGCKKPPEDYEIITINGVRLNQRTYTMLQHTAEIYQGEIDILGYAITQGSYTQQVEASFGTHAGGGAVDLSVMQKDTYTVLWKEIPPLIYALRVAGFAAWLRDLDELYPGSPIHIHAVAIGDRDLSPAAIDQLTGQYGYFRGYSGLPPEYGGPSPDRHGGPVICQWMIEMGYSDLRPTPTAGTEQDQLDCHKCQVK